MRFVYSTGHTWLCINYAWVLIVSRHSCLIKSRFKMPQSMGFMKRFTALNQLLLMLLLFLTSWSFMWESRVWPPLSLLRSVAEIMATRGWITVASVRIPSVASWEVPTVSTQLLTWSQSASE